MNDPRPRALHAGFIQPLKCALVLFLALSCTAYASAGNHQSVNADKAEKGLSWLTTDNLRFSGFIEAYGWSDLHKDARTEHVKSLYNRIRAEAKYTFADPDASSFAALQKQDPYLLISAESEFLWFGKDNEYSDHDLDVYEAYFHLDQGPWQLRLGKQNVRWGKTDQLSPVDNINAQDLRQFILLDLEDRKIPNWMARLRYFHQDWTLEGVFIPFFEADELDYFGTDWALYRQAKQDVQDSRLPAEIKSFVQDLGVQKNTPSNTLGNSGLGFRVARELGQVDLAASWLTVKETMPHIQTFPVQNLRVTGPFSARDIQDAADHPVPVPGEDIQVDYLRTRIYGLEFESVLQDFGIRGEAAYFDRQSFLQEDLTSTAREVIHVVAGLDYMGSSGWYANVQLSEQKIFDYQDHILFFKEHNVSLLGELSKEWARGTWEASAQGLYYLTDKSWHLNPELTHSPLPALDLSLGLHMFQGESDTILGQFDGNDQAYLRVKYYF